MAGSTTKPAIAGSRLRRKAVTARSASDPWTRSKASLITDAEEYVQAEYDTQTDDGDTNNLKKKNTASKIKENHVSRMRPMFVNF